MKKLLSLVLALFLCSILTLTAFADAWVPPTDDGGYCEALEDLANSSSGAELFNRFASEYLHSKEEDSSDFLSVNICYYLGDREYYFWFSLYETTDDPEECYALYDPETAENAELVGSCVLQLLYSGDVNATKFDTSDFTITYFELYTASGEEIDVMALPELHPVTEAPEETEAETVEEPETTATKDTGRGSSRSNRSKSSSEASTGSNFWTTERIIIMAAVGAVVIAAAIAIVLIWKKKS